MTGNLLANAAVWSYGVAAAAFVLLVVRVAVGLKASRHGLLLLAAIGATAVWAVCGALFSATNQLSALVATIGADTLRYAVWYGFIVMLLNRDFEARSDAPSPRWLTLVAGVVLAGALATFVVELGGWMPDLDSRIGYAFRVGMAISGLVFVEQLYRVAHPQARWGIKPLALALAATFGYDLVLYADALLFSRLDADLWIARGAANALLVPFFMVATARNKGWSVDMHLSRNAVFHSTALLVSGAFLLAVSGAGYLVRYIGGGWGRALQIELIFGAALLLALVATSGRFRSHLRVFVSKHFFSYRYDYREEWLRFTRTLSTHSPVHGPQERAILALADLVESPGGMLWLRDEHGAFVATARLNMQRCDAAFPAESSLTTFLARTGWVVLVSEAIEHPSRYLDLTVPAEIRELPNRWLVVPLANGSDLLGFTVLLTPRSALDVDWEVRDLLKAAARAAAAYLAQVRATEALLEVRKFDAFNRMSAFVVHDLKNLVAQLSLMLRNAERHRDNPDFQRDMFTTVEHVVSRMNALMLQLRVGTTPVENARPVQLASIVRRVCRAKGIADGVVKLDLSDGIYAFGHEDRLEHVIGHLIQNAFDATTGGGVVSVAIGKDAAYAWVDVNDTGVGMSDAFQRERLFKPFETTKESGMGIGVYESQQYVQGVGGRIVVQSREGQGTAVRVMFPSADEMGSPPAPLAQVA
ncbi:MAG TPA: XrtA/PEP-CTERM system histidine kinase PrsK [Casimicrobiaceae bacterium]|nr:XrtA/PEP-CTERM system histidine kinase PrsK [Casimicrobiaceae bacterium]